MRKLKKSHQQNKNKNISNYQTLRTASLFSRSKQHDNDSLNFEVWHFTRIDKGLNSK